MKQTRLLRLELNEVPPREFRIFPYGVIETTKGIFIFDERAAEQVMAVWRDYGFPTPAGMNLKSDAF